MRIEMNVEADGASGCAEVPQLDAAEKEIAIKVDGIADRHLQIERRRSSHHARDERVIVVFERLDPGGIADPGEFAVAPDAEKRDVANGLVLLPDMRPIHIADVVLMIEVDHEVAVADRQVARHVARITAACHPERSEGPAAPLL
ncbi:MAG: hypothetical protein DMF58_17225 [Acidobacteria bacterium]|nr:MAG: hypothetical protein DMF58_17225 [Acidobacteriota bacterium]